MFGTGQEAPLISPGSVADVDLEAGNAGCVGQLLMTCGRLLNELGIARLREETGLAQLRTVHTKLFAHIDREGTRLTQLATRVGISKQAVGQLVDQLHAMGAVERVPDPMDGRAKLIRFRRKGEQGLWMHGSAVLGQLEDEIESELGGPQMAQLEGVLLRLEGFLSSLAAQP